MAFKHFILSIIVGITSAADYFVDEQYNCTNFESVNAKYVTYLGQFKSTQDCIQECINKKCDSYSWYATSNPGNTSGACYSYVNNSLWLPYKTTKSNCGRIIYPCQDDTDCSLNGKCDTSTRNCTCNAGWEGYKCHFMSLLPANKNAGYFAPFGSADSTSWGGSVQFDKVTNKYVMLVAVMQYNCGINSWRVNSEIVFAETAGNDWNSAYTKKEAILFPFAHSPGIIYAPDTDEMVLIHVRNTSENGNTPPCKICVNGTTASGCNTHQADSETTTLITISSQNFSTGYDIKQWSEPIYLEALGHGDSNFAAVINKDSSLVGMTRNRVISASDWKDNTTYKVFNTPFPYVTSTEDFYVYRDCSGNYHALFHNMDPNDDQALCGAHAYSVDGVSWQYGGLAFSNEVKFTDGTSFTFGRRERPHLIFDSDRCTPIALTSAAEYYHDKSFTLLQPLKH